MRRQLLLIASVVMLIFSSFVARAQSTKYPPSGGGGGGVSSVTASAPLTGGTITTTGTIGIPASTNSVNGYLTSADHTTFAAKAVSGANADITSLSKIGASGIVFNDGEGSPKTVTLDSPGTLNASYTLQWPVDAPTTTAQPLCFSGGSLLTWCDPLTSFVTATSLNTKTQALAGTHPMVAAFCTAADGNQDVTGAGGGAVCDGVGGQFGITGGAVILTAQTDPTQNGLWDVNGFGAWVYDPSWGDQGGGCSGQSDGYILSVKAGGTTYGDTVWQLKCVAGNATFVQIPVSTRSGTCTVASTTLSTTATNETCTGVPASSHIAVQCSGQAAFSTPTAGGVYCRATGTANQIACNTIAVNTTAMAYSCAWTQP